MQMNHYTNKKSLALLGHGKWKSALSHTLLLIGMVLVSMGAFAQEPSNGLYLHKDWEPDPTDPTGSRGVIRLETFVTGDKIITETHTPTDIVLVLDVSGSMNDNISQYTYTARNSQGYSYNGYGNNTYYYKHTDGKYYAVERQQEWYSGMFNPRYYYRLRFQVNGTYYYLSGNGVTATAPTNVTNAGTTIWTGVLYTRAVVPGTTQTKLAALKNAVNNFVDVIAEDAEEFEVDHRISIVKFAMNSYYGGAANIEAGNHFDNNNYNHTEVLINRSDPRTEAANIKTAVNGMRAAGATAADFGMNKARYLLASIPEDEYEERNKVVVMFTDGSPTYESNFQDAVANNAIGFAYDLKHSANDLLAPFNNKTYEFNATVFTIGVFDNETEDIHTYMDRTSSNYSNATSMTNVCVKDKDGYYALAESADALNDIFESIAQESGSAALPMGSETVVKDEISSSFQLNIPDGYTEDPSLLIKAYAPKCIGKNGNSFTFESEIDGTNRLVMGTDEDGNEHVVIDGGDENRLPDGIVEYDSNTKTLTFTNFNFEAMFVAEEKDEQGTPLGIYTGRKLVMLIPLEIGDGSWGDGIVTNGPISLIYPDGDVSNPIYFNVPTANVLGSVWTEVITTRPPGFPEVTGDGSNQTVEIDSPEDLAWFISEVNGRIGYNVKDGYNSNNVASHPKLNGRLTADIDMSRHNWVPIGCGWQVEIGNDGLTQFIKEGGQNVHMTYEGTFDGNGHVITGLKNNASKYYKQITQNQQGVVVFPGMFSDVKGTIKNVFVLDADFRGKHHNENFVHHGIIADTLEAGGNIFNCEAAGRITCNNDDKNNDSQLIYGGLVGLNNGGDIHSCMAMAELTAYTMGGMIGENRGSFSNGFTNGVYNYLDNGVTGKFAGGIAATNTGTINNCYVRFERPNTNLDKMGTGFGMIYGSNTGTVNNYYTPQIVTWSRPDYESNTTAININPTVPTTITEPAGNNSNLNSYTLSINPSFYNMFTNDNMTGGTWGTLGSYNVYEKGTPLVDKLIANKGDGATWKRTTAGRYTDNDLTGYVSGDINDDYPVLQFEGYTCLGSADGIRIDYAASLNDMLHRHNNGKLNENTQINNEFTSNNADYYKVSGHAAINGGAINLFVNDDVTLETTGGKDGEVADDCTAEGVVVYIDENISLLQGDDSEIEAYTGQTLEAFDNTDIQAGERWHNISSSLEDSQFGWVYLNEEQVEHNWETDPCGWNLNNHDEDYAFYPIDLSSYHRADFYCFYEPQYHWLNFRRNSLSHWHMDLTDNSVSTTIPSNHAHIDYVNELGENGNETSFIPGKGYLTTVDMSTWWSLTLNGTTYSKKAQFMQNRGTLNNGDVTIPVSYTAANEWTGLAGYNLLGNPYQSFLDFDAFVSQNATLMGNSNFANTYAVYDPNEGNYVQYKSGSSKGSRAAGQYINMHQGFFIQVNAGGTATFTNAMRSNSGTPNFRGEQPAYPLINFIVKDNEGNTDLAILECNRPENDGAKKLRTGNAAGRIYFRYDNENLAIYFRNSDKDYQTLNFAAEEDGNFTLSWERANDDFRTLTLVDNITGIKTDMLTHDHYTFEGRVDDYNTRFKIVFGEMDNNEEEPVLEHFAFFDHGNLIVNGTGHFEVVDVLGRVVYATELTDTQNTVSLPSNVRGVCMLCFTRNNETKVQKMVIQ
jgi:hypothetical protein